MLRVKVPVVERSRDDIRLLLLVERTVTELKQEVEDAWKNYLTKLR